MLYPSHDAFNTGISDRKLTAKIVNINSGKTVNGK
jgi:hypothetical protein